MPDARSPIRHHLVLYRREPGQGRARFFSLMIERDLFGTIRLVRNWGLVGSKGQVKVETFFDETQAAQAKAGQKPSDARAIQISEDLTEDRCAVAGSVSAPGWSSIWRGVS
ncbi:WGR domain-containing protein [Microvirga tunisiensis]|uniref:WGR domain-containing protein n=1 Tax=Microvirga tunisiensis TaxID=2108360 RepID=UPI001FCF21F7|nr:WGR domain-containing protein [Microvirga tunisiensis]